MTWNLDGNANKGLQGLWLTFKDATTINLANVNTAITATPASIQTFCGNFVGQGANFNMASNSAGAAVSMAIAADSYDDVPVNYYTLFKYFTDFTYVLNDPMVTK